jgi:hypothetical protein
VGAGRCTRRSIARHEFAADVWLARGTKGPVRGTYAAVLALRLTEARIARRERVQALMVNGSSRTEARKLARIPNNQE